MTDDLLTRKKCVWNLLFPTFEEAQTHANSYNNKQNPESIYDPEMRAKFFEKQSSYLFEARKGVLPRSSMLPQVLSECDSEDVTIVEFGGALVGFLHFCKEANSNP